LSACVVVIASDIGVNTTNSRITRVNGAVSVIVTDSSHVDVCLEASSRGIAILNLAFVQIVAVLLCVDTSVGDRITRVVSANIVVIAVLGSRNTSSVSWIALVGRAWNRWANNGNWIQAEVAGLCWIRASSVRIANVSCAGIVVVTINRSVSASHLRVTSGSSASVGGCTCNVGKEASSCWVAHVVCASIAVVASDWAINTSVSTNVGSATLRSAHVTILTCGRAHTSSTARAETGTTTTTRRCGNSQTSGLDKSVEDSLEGLKRWNGWISSSNSCNCRGQGTKLSLIHLRSNSKREDENTSVLGVVDNLCKGVCVDVVGSVGHYNHDGDYSILSPSSKVDHFRVARCDTTSNASTSLSLEDSIHRVQEGVLRESDVDGKTGVNTELNQSHSHLIDSKDIRTGKVTNETD